MSDENWIDCSVIGSPYRQQLDMNSGRWRHRYRKIIPGDPMVTIESPWTFGRAPEESIFDPRDIDRFSGGE